MMVKVCGITNLDDALAAADAGASAVGFNFWPRSPRYIAPEEAARIAERLPGSLWSVGVFVNEPAAQMIETARIVGLDVMQFHGDETQADLPPSMRVWKAYRVDVEFSAESLDQFPAEAYLLDGPAGGQYGGSGRAFDWSRVAGLGRKIIVGGGLDASNVRAAIEAARPWGVDACSRLESSPGRKDHDKVRAFVTAARQ